MKRQRQAATKARKQLSVTEICYIRIDLKPRYVNLNLSSRQYLVYGGKKISIL